jgi:hypothetical protein
VSFNTSCLVTMTLASGRSFEGSAVWVPARSCSSHADRAAYAAPGVDVIDGGVLAR